MQPKRKFLLGHNVKTYLVGGINLWWSEVYWGKILPGERVGGGGEQILADRDDLPHPSCRENPVHSTKFHPYHTKCSFSPLNNNFPVLI